MASDQHNTVADSSPAPTALREMLSVAGPVVATMTSYTLMTFTDKFLSSRLGPDPIYVGAQGNGNLASWVPVSIAHGTLTIINTYVAQNLGAGRPERGPAYAWNGLWIALLYWLFVLVPYAFFVPTIFRIAQLDPAQAEIATEYAQILVFGSVLTMATRSLGQYFFGMHKAGIIMIAGITANILNLFLAAMFAYGNGPRPDFGDAWLGTIMTPVVAAAHATATALDISPMGVAGSAWGTVIATGVEMLIPMAVFLSPKFNALYHTRAAWRWSTSHVKELVKLGWPGGAMFGNEMICWGFFMVYLVSHFGKVHATAGWIAHQYMALSFMPAVGISVATTAVVGKYQGMRRPDISQHRAFLGLKLAAAYMVACGICFVVFREHLIQLFVPADAAPETREALINLGSKFLIATACFQLFDAVAMTMSGALRGAGDTIVPGIATVLLSWVVIVGGGLAMVTFVPSLQSVGAWIAAAGYIFLLCCFLLGRFLTGRWKTIQLVDPAQDPASEPQLAAAAATDGIV